MVTLTATMIVLLLIGSVLGYLFVNVKDSVYSALTKRNPKWWGVRTTHITVYNKCKVCSTQKSLDVHHIIPVSVDPSLELNFDNLVTLCRHHHFYIGHKGNWNDFNINVEEDCNQLKEIYERR